MLNTEKPLGEERKGGILSVDSQQREDRAPIERAAAVIGIARGLRFEYARDTEGEELSVGSFPEEISCALCVFGILLLKCVITSLVTATHKI